MKGKIVLIPFPFTDLTSAKLRPALVLYQGKYDLILAFISSQTTVQRTECEIYLQKNTPEFLSSGLKMDSVIRLDKIATVLNDLVIAELGELDISYRNELNRKISSLLQL